MATSGPSGHNPNPTTNPPITLTFYPAYCFPSSPTYFTWVKLTAHDIHHTLLPHNNFKGQNLYFYLNHPIQFVYLVGVVVSYEDFYEKRWILVVDDGSGKTIEVVYPKPLPLPQQLGKEKGVAGQEGEQLSKADQARLAEEKEKMDTMASIDIGSVIKVKGRIGTFRDTRQIQLERVAVVADTNVEMRFWEERMKVKREVLQRPWVVGVEEVGRLKKKAEGREEGERVRGRKRVEWEKKREEREERHRKRILMRWEEEERKRSMAAEVARQAGELHMASRRLGKGVKGTSGTNGAVISKKA